MKVYFKYQVSHSLCAQELHVLKMPFPTRLEQELMNTSMRERERDIYMGPALTGTCVEVQVCNFCICFSLSFKRSSSSLHRLVGTIHTHGEKYNYYIWLHRQKSCKIASDTPKYVTLHYQALLRPITLAQMLKLD